jgi:DNA-binding NarL/FixJ family response regulator
MSTSPRKKKSKPRRPTADRKTRLARAVALRLEGQKEADIAAALGVRVSTVSEYLNCEEGRDLLAEARAKLTQSVGAAGAKLIALLDCGLPSEERRAACDILRVTGADRWTRPAAVDFTDAARIKATLQATAAAILRGEVSEEVIRPVTALAALAARIVEMEDLEERMERLEAALGGTDAGAD